MEVGVEQMAAAGETARLNAVEIQLAAILRSVKAERHPEIASTAKDESGDKAVLGGSDGAETMAARIEEVKSSHKK